MPIKRAPRRYVFIGAGAIGGGIGGLLSAHHVSAVLVARGDHLDRLQSHGMRLRMPDTDIVTPVAAIASPDEIVLTDNDILVLATKTQHAEQALAQWADVPVGERPAGEVLPILTALNGVSAERRALRWFRRVYGVCVWMPAVRLAPGEVIIRGVPTRGLLHVARVPAELTTDEDRLLLDRVATDWSSAGLEVPRHDDVMPWKYRKLLSNLGNAVQALLGTGGDDITEAARGEADQIYAAAGSVMNAEGEEQRYRAKLRTASVPGAPSALGGSTWQSLARQVGTTEVDFLNGEIVAIAHQLGVTAPINAGLSRLTRHATRVGALPGELTANELRAALGMDSMDEPATSQVL